jgi:ferredoxin
MKIFYFSATGNSLSVAKQLSDGKAEVINIAAFDQNTAEDHSIGIVFPVFCYDIPLIVKRFLLNKALKSPYIWAAATCGSTVGYSFVTINKLLKKRGQKLSYCKKIVLPDSCIAFKTPLDKQPQMLSAQKDIVKKISQDIAAKTENPVFKDKLLPINGAAWWGMKNIFGIKNKRVNADCDKCGVCVRICPVKNIEMRDKPVFINKDCENCFACIQWCPKRAISFGKLKIDDASKYNHPDITLQEMLKNNQS